MIKNLILLISILIFISCKGGDQIRDTIFEVNQDSLFIDKEINIITHGDTPIWLNKNIQEVDFLLTALDSLPIELVVIEGNPLDSIKSDKLVSKFDLKKGKSESDTFITFTGKNLELVVESGEVISLNLKPNIDLSINGIRANEFGLSNAKENFPKSYRVRNYYGDSYRAKLYNLSFGDYDHLVLKISYTNFFIHFRFIDSKLIDLEINKLRT